MTKEDLVKMIAEATKEAQPRPQQKELNGNDLQILIDHAKTCKDGVCEIKNVWNTELKKAIKEDVDICEGCGAVLSKKEKPEYCPECEEELDW